MTRARQARVLAVAGVLFGAFFLGIATALAVVWFGGVSDYRLQVTLAMAALAGAFLTLGAVSLRSSIPAADPRPRAAAEVPNSIGPHQAPVRAKPPGASPRTASARHRPHVEPDTVVRRDSSPQGRAREFAEPSPPEAAAPTRDIEPGAEAGLRPADLIEAWDEYQRDGDGHFNPGGMGQVLGRRRIPARAESGNRIGLGSSALIVQGTGAHGDRFFVLPNFAKSSRAVREWFDNSGAGALNARTERLIRVAEGRWTGDGGYERISRGEVA